MSQRLPAVKPKDALRALLRAGFVLDRISGSHHILKHPAKPALRVTIPVHGKDMRRRTLLSLIEQAGFSTEEFIDLL
jgi:predicted RNA binding protein YcfA (HicA-like mRNA interferase family)